VCQKASPIVDRLYKAIKEDPVLKEDVKVLGVACGDDQKKIDEFKKRLNLSFPFVPDQEYKVFLELKLMGLPVMIVANKEGKVLMNHSGMIKDLDHVLQEIREIHTKQ